MPGKCTPTQNNRHCVQAVLELLTSCCSNKATGLRTCSKYQLVGADPSSLKKKGGEKEEWGQNLNNKYGERGRGAQKKKEQVRVEQDAEQRAGSVLKISEDLKPIQSEGVAESTEAYDGANT